MRRLIGLLMAGMLASVLIATVGQSPANAWPWDSHVDLNGNASCHAEHADMVNIALDNGETGATVPNNYGTYFISFFRIAGGGGTSGTAYTRAASNHSWCSKRITVTRPLTGNTQYLLLNM
jgi:hypothetical protein